MDPGLINRHASHASIQKHSEKVPKMIKQAEKRSVLSKLEIYLVSPGNFKPKIGARNST
jgi:hypothetical protein